VANRPPVLLFSFSTRNLSAAVEVMSFVSTAHSQPHINEQITPYLSTGPSSTHSVKTGSRGMCGIDYDATDDFEDAPATHTIDDIIEHIGGFGRYQQRLFVILGFTFMVNFFLVAVYLRL